MNQDNQQPRRRSSGSRAAQNVKKPSARPPWLSFGKVVGTLFLVMITTIVIFAGIFLTYVNNSIVPQSAVDVSGITAKLSSKIMCKDSVTGEWKEMQTIYADENRILIDYEQLPDYVEKALVAIEDKRFYEHKGVDWKSTAKAVFTMFFGSANRGGSTLTQQLIKNVTGDDEVTVKRKVTEIVRALELEKKYHKWEIVEMYLNTVYFGQSCYGIGAAAKTYFGKTVEELTVAEAAAIIGITNSPTANDPLRSEKCRSRCLARKDLILSEMYEQEKLTKEEYEAAKAQKLVFVGDEGYVDAHPGGEAESNNKVYSYFVDQVIRDVIAELQEQKGVNEETARTLLYSAGYTIYCTMDERVQEIVDSVYTNLENLPYTSVRGQQLQSAITITDPATGNIVAMCGGMGEKTASLTQNLAYRSRPCGSAIKPLSVYSAALEKGIITPASIIDDYPVEYNEELERAWPKNAYTGYKGLYTLRLALINSSNTCAVRTLDMVGVEDSYTWMSQNLGFTTLVDADKDRGPLGMGGLTNGVNTVEMAAAYASFANNGIYNTPRTFTEVRDKDNQLVLENKTDTWAAMSENTAYMMNDLLKQVVSVGTGTSAKFDGMTIAGKTGTTTNNYDRYFVGYTPYYSAAVWIGYEYMENIKASGNPAAVLWKKVMSQVHEGLENKDFLGSDAGLEEVTVCNKSGLLPSALCTACGDVQTVQVPKDLVPEEECDMHVTRSVCTSYDVEGNAVRHLAGAGCAVFGTTTAETLLDYNRVLVYPTTGGDTEEGSVIAGEAVRADDSDRVIQQMTECPNHFGGYLPPVDDPNTDPSVDPLDPSGGDTQEPGGNFWENILGGLLG